MTERAHDHGLAAAAKPPLALVLLLGSLTALGPVSIDMYLPGLPQLGATLHASPAAATQTVSVFFIALACGQLLYGPLSDRIGRRPPLLVGLTLYVVGSVACALAPSIHVLLAARVLQALGSSSGGVLARAAVRDRFPPNQTLHVFSLLMLVLGLSPILAPMFGGWILLAADWRWIFWFQAGFGAVLLVAVALRLKESRPEEAAAHARKESAFGSYLNLLRNRQIQAYMLTGALAGSAFFTYLAVSSTVLIGRYHLGPQAYGYVFGMNGAGLIIATQINARLARRWRSDDILRRAVVVALCLALVLLALAVTGFGGLPALLLVLFLLVSTNGLLQPNSFNGAMNVDARRAGATSSLSGAVSFGFGSVISAIAGALNDGTARPMAAVMALSLSAAAVCAITLIPRRAPHPA